MAVTPPTAAPPNSTDANSSPLQSNYQDNQIYEIDIDQIYNDYIQNIDNKRSHVNVRGQNTQQLLAAIGGNPEAPTTNNLVPAKSLQESRCHAFFRIIGFPVVNHNQSKYYNPGHDIIYGQRSIDLAAKIAIAEDSIANFDMLSNAREQYPLRSMKIFATPNTIDAGVLSLSGGANPGGMRPFSSPFLINQQPFDVVATNQAYSGVYVSIVGGGSPGDSGEGNINLIQYYDASYNTPASTTLTPDKYHIIKPFIVDPRIDFTCSPSTNRIGVPFVPNNSFLQISSTVYAEPPILEIVIRDRFTVTNQLQNSGDITQQFATVIKEASTAPPDQSLLGQISQNNIQQLSTNSQFVQFVNIVQAMVKKLVEAQKNIASAQSQYYWVPVPSTSGPEGGSSIQGVFLPPTVAVQTANNITPLVTSYDADILIRTAQSLFSQTQQNAQASSAIGQPDPGGFAVSLKNSLGPSSTSSYVNSSMVNLDGLTSRRQGILSKSSDSLRTIEIIMGEFSGLGLCDMIAVLGALYTMPPLSLLGFLDIDAFARFSTQFPGYSNPGIRKAMTDFCTTVNQFYQLMEAAYQSELSNQGAT